MSITVVLGRFFNFYNGKIGYIIKYITLLVLLPVKCCNVQCVKYCNVYNFDKQCLGRTSRNYDIFETPCLPGGNLC